MDLLYVDRLLFLRPIFVVLNSLKKSNWKLIESLGLLSEVI